MQRILDVYLQLLLQLVFQAGDVCKLHALRLQLSLHGGHLECRAGSGVGEAGTDEAAREEERWKQGQQMLRHFYLALDVLLLALVLLLARPQVIHLQRLLLHLALKLLNALLQLAHLQAAKGYGEPASA